MRLVAFLDADDLWLPGKLAAQLAALAEEPDLAGVFTHIRNEYVRSELKQRFRAVEGNVRGVCASTLLVRRDALVASGGFDETTQRVEFIEWYARAVGAGLRFRVLPKTFAIRRIHGENQSIRLASRTSEYARLAHELIRRRRAARGRDASKEKP